MFCACGQTAEKEKAVQKEGEKKRVGIFSFLFPTYKHRCNSDRGGRGNECSSSF